MTFEEFLIKKKIDPVQLEANEHSLFSEFNSHYVQMGEKSFDHSKKFWFNKLRRAYHIKEEPKTAREEAAALLPVTSTQEQKASQALSEPVKQEKTAYVPRFKASAAQKGILPVQKSETDTPPAYKPEIKAAITVPEQAEAINLSKEGISGEKANPVYKPRFKAQITVSGERTSENKEESLPQSPDHPKPAYKPRFKPGLTKKDPGRE